MTKIIQRHDTAANWTAANPVLAAGEMGVETDTNKFKFGDGTSTWSELAYAGAGTGGGEYVLPIANSTTLGGIKVGENLIITEDGTLSAGSEVFNKDAFNIVGSPTITENGIASGFGQYNYVKIPLPNLSNANSWEIQGVITTASVIQGEFGLTSILGSDVSDRVLVFQIPTNSSSDKYLHFHFSIGNISSWVFDLDSTNTVETNTKYYYRIIFTGTSYEVLLSKNGVDYVKEMEAQSTAKIPYSSSYNIIFGIPRGLQYDNGSWEGTMDLSKFKIIADGITVFSGSKFALPTSGGSGTTLTSADGTTTYSKLALGNNLVVDTGDIAWTNPAMTSNSQNGYVASASVSASTSNGPYRAFDKDITGQDLCWYTGSVSMPQWIMLECPEPVRLTSCMIMNEVKTPESFKSGYIQGSNDGSTFDTLYTITDRASTSGLQTTYQIDTNKYYKYLRVYCTATSGNGISVQEIEFKGFVKDPSAVPSLNVNLDELGNEVNTLASTVSTVEASIAEKQDKLIAELPLSLEARDIKQLNMDERSTGGILDKDNLTYKAMDTMSSTNYGLITKQSFDFSSASTWEFVIKTQLNITRPSGSTSTYARIFGSKATGFECAVQVEDGLVRFGISTDGSTKWTKYTATSTSGLLNNLVWIKVEFTGSAYVWSTSLDGVTYTQRNTYASSNRMPINTSIGVGFGLDSKTIRNYHSGTIYLKDSYFIIDGKKTPLAEVINGAPVISSNTATTTSLGVVQPDGTSITVSETGVISGQDVKTFTGYSDTGTLVLKSINGVLQWVAEG